MRRCMKNPHSLKVRHYAARLIYLNGYLASFPGATMSNKMGVTESNEILLNSMPNRWYKKSYIQGFDCETIYFIKLVNTFVCMEIAESIYEGVVTPSYKKTTRVEANRTEISRNNRGEYAFVKHSPHKG